MLKKCLKNPPLQTGFPIAPSLQTIKQASIGINMDFETVPTMIDQDENLNPDPFANYKDMILKLTEEKYEALIESNKNATNYTAHKK